MHRYSNPLATSMRCSLVSLPNIVLFLSSSLLPCMSNCKKTGFTYRSRHFIIPIGQLFPVLLLELRKPIKVVDQTNIVPFHSNASRDQNTPRNRLGVQADALQQTHIPFLLGSRLGILNDLREGIGLVGPRGARVSIVDWRDGLVRLGLSHGGNGGIGKGRSRVGRRCAETRMKNVSPHQVGGTSHASRGRVTILAEAKDTRARQNEDSSLCGGAIAGASKQIFAGLDHSMLGEGPDWMGRSFSFFSFSISFFFSLFS